MPATAVDHEHRVTPRELFFDLVFVFAFTQVATLLANDPTFAGIGRGVLGWPRSGGRGGVLRLADDRRRSRGQRHRRSTPRGADRDVRRSACGAASSSMARVCSSGPPSSSSARRHTALYALVGRGPPRPASGRAAPGPRTLGGVTLILVAGFTDGCAYWLWLAALTCTYVGAVATGTSGWRLHPSHFAERYGLIVIIALGEAFISIGIGGSATAIGLREVVASVLGLLIATSFLAATTSTSSRFAASTRFRPRGRRSCGARPRSLRVRTLPDDRRHRALRLRDEDGDRTRRRGARLVAAFALCGGSALYLLAYSGSVAGRRTGEAEPRPLRGRSRARAPAPGRDRRSGAGRSGARHRRLGGVPHVRVRVVARGSRRVTLDARVLQAQGFQPIVQAPLAMTVELVQARAAM